MLPVARPLVLHCQVSDSFMCLCASVECEREGNNLLRFVGLFIIREIHRYW